MAICLWRAGSVARRQIACVAQNLLAVGRAQEGDEALNSRALLGRKDEVELLAIRVRAALKVLQRGLNAVDGNEAQVAFLHHDLRVARSDQRSRNLLSHLGVVLISSRYGDISAGAYLVDGSHHAGERV